MIRILLVMLVPLLNACSASLNVRVATLDPEYVRSQITAQGETNACRQAVAESYASIMREIDGLAADLSAHHDLVYTAYVAAINANSNRAAALIKLAEEVRISPQEAISFYGLDTYQQNRFKETRAVHQAAAASTPTAFCTRRSAALNVALNSRDELIATKAAELGRKLEDLRKHATWQGSADSSPDAARSSEMPSHEEAAVAADPKVVASQQAITRKATSVLGSNALTLSTSPYAYLVSSADKCNWQPNFNQAFGSGVMGNLDIAIILNETADFSVKGMRFDASKVAEVAAKVTSQALHLAVQMTGVAPVSAPSPTPEQQPSALAQSTAALVTAQQQEAVRDTLLQTRTRALFDLADTLTANHALVTDANKSATAASIRARLAAQLPLLKLQMPVPVPTP